MIKRLGELRAIHWIFVAAIVRMLVILTAPVDLSGDEAYYWEWGRHLDWGYFSKPPLIGWLMGLAGGISHDAEWGIRAMAVVLSTASLLLLNRLTERLFGERAGFWVVVAILLTPGNAAANLIFTIDGPLVLSWVLALYAGHRYGTDPDRRVLWAVVLGLALALGYLSKQMMLVFPMLWIVFLLLEKDCRPLLKHPLTWSVLILPLLALIPPLMWNANQDWITFRHTGGHFAAKSFTLTRSLGWLSEFIGSQLGLMTPVTFVVIVVVLFLVVRHWKSVGPDMRYLWIFCAPALFIFLLLSLRQRILPNWPAVYYVSALVLTTGWLFSSHPFRPSGRLRRSFKRGLWVAVPIVALLYLTLYLTPFLPLDKDPLERIRGWDAYGKAIAEVDRNTWPDRDGIEKKRVLEVVGHRYYASELAFYHPERPRVFLYNPPGHIRSQYGLWEPIESSGAQTGLVIQTRPQKPLPEEILHQWETIEFLTDLKIPVTPHSSREVRIYKTTGLRYTPPK